MQKIKKFVKECRDELKKVVWPSREDALSSVKVVIVSTVVIACVLGLIDVILLAGVQAIF
jgi:preprotein translocase subunit SecE